MPVAGAEFVNLQDVEGMRRLCQALMRSRLPWQDPWRTVRRRLQRNVKVFYCRPAEGGKYDAAIHATACVS
ncbi:hypothetical protein [Thiohalobacter thiocyanaticus]|uniref:Uncharacterized protein n=1 Tax=Thiohalobacter thiocyanaticus TaxID=585455 RepID=A0A426QKV5_9GAMM|nr:hypothetical protein [Thiohalobacter thiocyanaticus]RRQ22414.1 hypothetical protein D6C00_10950 [Thiohalobacter thiocyanaticus]